MPEVHFEMMIPTLPDSVRQFLPRGIVIRLNHPHKADIFIRPESERQLPFMKKINGVLNHRTDPLKSHGPDLISGLSAQDACVIRRSRTSLKIFFLSSLE